MKWLPTLVDGVLAVDGVLVIDLKFEQLDALCFLKVSQQGILSKLSCIHLDVSKKDDFSGRQKNRFLENRPCIQSPQGSNIGFLVSAIGKSEFHYRITE
jgi:hypothetical protein